MNHADDHGRVEVSANELIHSKLEGTVRGFRKRSSYLDAGVGVGGVGERRRMRVASNARGMGMTRRRRTLLAETPQTP